MSASGDAVDLTLASLNSPDCLIYGIGNDGRQDDGLGWAFMDWLEAGGRCQRAEQRRHYQLQLEDADLISSKRRVLFVDASRDERLSTFAITRVTPHLDFSFTSHALSISAVLATCRTCFHRVPEVFQLALRGFEWELQRGLTSGALRNLGIAQAYFGGSVGAETTSLLCQETGVYLGLGGNR